MPLGLPAFLLLLLLVLAPSPAAAVQLTQFDHLTTGYELRGIHRDMSCEYCHVNGIFRGTPRTCAGCHTSGTRIDATPRPARHIAVRPECGSCHSQFNFLPYVRVDHALVIGSCFSCHNGVVAQGKVPGHIPSNNDCDACHTTNGFSPQRIEHTALIAAAAACRSCHNGVGAQALPRNHLLTAEQCGGCHSTVSWTPVRIDHAGFLTGCKSCHNGQAATGLPPAHMASARDCATCHRYPQWNGVVYAHAAAGFPSGHARVACNGCHVSGTEQASWKYGGYAPSCAGCHADQFRPHSHPKTTSGVPYSVAELQDCSAACHIHSNAGMTAIARLRPAGHHKASDGAFR